MNPLFDFNLVDVPWIPCQRSENDPPELLSLRAVFAQAARLRQIADTAPTGTISISRLLLAILHRSLNGPRNIQEWGRIWRQRDWPTDTLATIDAYLTRWRDRFNLFDTQHPFYQTPLPTLGAAMGITQLSYERASERNRLVLFDHTPNSYIAPPAEAARYLLAQQNFSVGGLMSYLSGVDERSARTAPSAPLNHAAVCLVLGNTVFETLLLNWRQYDPEHEIPFKFHGDDRPAWERDEIVRPEERPLDGYVDLLTWQSRRFLLVPDVSAGGQVSVKQAIFMKGYTLPAAFEQWQAEGMVAFKKQEKSQYGGSGWVPIGLWADRTVWRDSHALLVSVAEGQRRPAIFEWLATLMDRGELADHTLFPLHVYGLIPDKANILDWREETLPLPAAYLQQGEQAQDMAGRVKAGLDLAEAMARLLHAGAAIIPQPGKPRLVDSPLTVLCRELLAGGAMKPDPAAVRGLSESFGGVRSYWAQLDTPFRLFLTEIPNDVADGGEAAEQRWAEYVAAAAKAVFEGITRDLDTSAKALRARARASDQFAFCQNALMKPYRQASSASVSTSASATGEGI